MAQQMSLIPVSPRELTAAAFELEKLLQQIEDEDAAFDEAKVAHKETMTVLKQGVSEQRQLIHRARLERDEGLASAQVDALLNETQERS